MKGQPRERIPALEPTEATTAESFDIIRTGRIHPSHQLRRFDTALEGPARRRFADHVRQLLDSLDQPDREALQLIYFHGLTQDDAARTLGVPRSVLRSCVARGMRELSRRLVAVAP